MISPFSCLLFESVKHNLCLSASKLTRSANTVSCPKSSPGLISSFLPSFSHLLTLDFIFLLYLYALVIYFKFLPKQRKSFLVPLLKFFSEKKKSEGISGSQVGKNTVFHYRGPPLNATLQPTLPACIECRHGGRKKGCSVTHFWRFCNEPWNYNLGKLRRMTTENIQAPFSERSV